MRVCVCAILIRVHQHGLGEDQSTRLELAALLNELCFCRPEGSSFSNVRSAFTRPPRPTSNWLRLVIDTMIISLPLLGWANVGLTCAHRAQMFDDPGTLRRGGEWRVNPIPSSFYDLDSDPSYVYECVMLI